MLLALSGLWLLPIPVLASHFAFDTTDVNCSIMIRMAYPTSHEWNEGDELAVFTPAGGCAGAATFRSFPIGLAAWGDDALTDSIDGFREGEAIRFVHYDAIEEREYPLSEFFSLVGDPVWHANGLIIAELADEEPHFPVRPQLIRHRLECLDAAFFEYDFGIGPGPYDQAGVYTPAGLCAGLMVWDSEGQHAAGWAYGDDPGTEPIDGFRAGETFYFKFWSSDSNLTIDTLQSIIQLGDTVFVSNGSSTVRIWNDPVSVGNRSPLPSQYSITPVFPNPFNGRTKLRLELPFDGLVELTIFGIDGRPVRPTERIRYKAGSHEISIDLGNHPSGEYLCKVAVGGEIRTIPLHLQK
jgi:hypothetical protein